MGRGTCHMCGKCCEAIHIPYSPEEVTRIAERQRRWMDDTNDDAIFIHNHWKPITREEAYAINPYLEAAEQVADKAGMNVGKQYYYSCSQLDKATGLCTVHDLRPRVCSDYPWYGNKPNINEPLYAPECGYHVDIEDVKNGVWEPDGATKAGRD